jgi:hypothetical protein
MGWWRSTGQRKSMKMQMIELVNYFFFGFPYKIVVNLPGQRSPAKNQGDDHDIAVTAHDHNVSQ